VSFILKIIVALLTAYLKYKNDTSMQQDAEIQGAAEETHVFYIRITLLIFKKKPF
jgi:hypothetical protein